MSAMIFLIGTSSILLLLWIDRLGERQRANFLLVDALMDVQIHTATSHHWLEEYIEGERNVDIKNVWEDCEKAVRLVDASLNGGANEHGLRMEPLKNSNLRTQAEGIKSLLLEFKRIASELVERPGEGGIGTALNASFEGVFRAILSKASDLERILETENSQDMVKLRRLFGGVFSVWIIVVITATTGIWRLEKSQKLSGEALLKANEQLLFQAEELTGHREHLEEVVEKRTAELMTANELLQMEIAERMQTEQILKETGKQIRELSSRLINAQENERKRISMELHDELGQALNVIKLHVRLIEKGLREDQREPREDCEKLLVYIDQVIEDVRRLSLDLSPTVLEDLGLTSALRWIISNFSKMAAIKITSDVAEIDHLFPRNQWITIYRVIQEALTNIGKHAQAENVSVVIRRRDDKVIFSIKDDGKGFDLKQAAMNNASERGLGLTTMNERVTMMGGIHKIWSQERNGTRVTFSIPVEKGRA